MASGRGKCLLFARGIIFSPSLEEPYPNNTEICFHLLEAHLDQRLGLFCCGDSCRAFSDKEGDHILTSCSCLVWTEGTNLSNGQTSGHEPKDWQERWDDPGYSSPIKVCRKPMFPCAMGSVAVVHPIQFSAGWRRPCPAVPPLWTQGRNIISVRDSARVSLWLDLMIFRVSFYDSVIVFVGC